MRQLCPEQAGPEVGGGPPAIRLVGSGIRGAQDLAAVCDQFIEMAEGAKCRSVLLNFAQVDFISSVGLCKLLTLRNKLSANGGQLFLCNLNCNIRQVFEATKLDSVFDIDDQEPVLVASKF